MIVGAGGMGQTIARKIRKHPEYGLRVVGFVDEIEIRNGNGTVPGHLGEPQRLRALIASHAVERVIFTQWDESGTDTLELVRSLRDLDVQIDVLPRSTSSSPPARASIRWRELLLGLAPSGLSRSSALLKRALDVGVAGAGLVLLSPLGLVALAIATGLARPSHLCADPRRLWRSQVQDPQVPDDGRRCRGAKPCSYTE